MAELHELGALALGSQIASGERSALEVTAHFLARTEALNPRIGAFVTLDREGALAAAARFDEAKARGTKSSPAGGRAAALAGVPIGIKDLDPTAGVRTGMGSAAFRDQVPTENSPLADRLLSGGAISLGKTATPEFGLVCYTEPEGEAPCRTPWDLERSPSGSSGGAAAAVAAGLVPWAPGGDGGGSIRTPASTCGVVGLKPSRGRCGGPDAMGFSVHGPIARTIEDIAAALDLMKGAYPGDMDAAPAVDSFLALTRPIERRLRIARYTVPMHRRPVDQECLDAVDSATAMLTALGHEVVEIDCPFPEGMAEHFLVLWSSAASSLPLTPQMEEQLRPITRWFRERGRAIAAGEFLQSMLFVREAAKAAIRATLAYDVVLTPTLAQVPRLIGQLRNDADPETESDDLINFTPFTPPYNVSGQPGLSLPLHWEANSLPIGVQLVGKPYDELTLLQLGAELEQSNPWNDRKPPLW